MDNVSERKDNMRLGMTLTSNPRDSSFVSSLGLTVCLCPQTCGPLWSHECGSSLYSTGICSRTFMDIVIVLDGSNSIYPWYEVQDFLITILQKFYIGPGFKRGGRPGAKKVMIVITDGESHDSPQLVQAVADSERDNVLGYYNRRGINPEAFLKEIKFIASDPDEQHFFNVTDESSLKDIDGVLLGAVGAYDWNGAVLKETKHGKVVPPKSSYKDEFPEELKNHGAYLGYSVGSLISSRGAQLYVAGAPRFNHTGKVIVFTLKNTGNLTILQALLGEQIGSYFGSVLISMDVSDRSQNARLGSALAQIPDMNGDGFRELVVGAPLEDDHQGALYVFYGHQKTLQHRFRQRVSASGLSSGLQYFGQSLHGVLDANGDGLVDLAVGALGAAVIVWSRGVVRIQATLTFEPEKVNMFNKDCRRGGKEVTCMSVCVVQSGFGREAFSPRAVLDESERQQPRILSPDDGPVLDPDWPNVLRAELPFWNGCEQEDVCVPDLILHSHTDLMSAQQFCGSSEGASWSLCSQQGAPQGSLHVVEAGRRRVVVFARLENQGENAYGASVQISTSSNLLFSSLIVKDQSDIQIECHSEDRLANQRNCTISAPFLKSLSQVSFHLEFEFSRSVFLDHIRVLMATSSEGEDGFPDDNIKDIFLPLKYQTDLLFTRAEIWAVTRGGNQLLNITDYSVLQVQYHDLYHMISINKNCVSGNCVSGNCVSGNCVSGTVSQGTVSQGTVSQGTVSQGTVSQGTVSQGTVSQGIVSQGTVSQGTVSQGTVSQGTVSQGTVSQELRPLSLLAASDQINQSGRSRGPDTPVTAGEINKNQSTGVSEVFSLQIESPSLLRRQAQSQRTPAAPRPECCESEDLNCR
ncbi:hypothetical protein F7725_023474 [Dissostichus mawsoni]|uniref:VWFA domain-containing protein n=1 Tax=Dissostichus mawsoni TaxID=36200 RepID=A0A7J5Z2Z9_DISMA|nr:hypothetical protein F7725_023474 [Dissostichus mawsoni]